ncbi:hypothetical protein ABZS61_31565 [Streptomyces sp. NPDC005566]|uniref:hypothetical protein n=1 Tax=Streptomyces sp. NPDC005566 TaxID=3156886 RepID=UPI00339F8475
MPSKIYARLVRELTPSPAPGCPLGHTAVRVGRTPDELAFAALTPVDKRTHAVAPHLP